MGVNTRGEARKASIGHSRAFYGYYVLMVQRTDDKAKIIKLDCYHKYSWLFGMLLKLRNYTKLDQPMNAGVNTIKYLVVKGEGTATVSSLSDC